MLKKILLTLGVLLLGSGLHQMLATAHADAYTVNKGGSTTSTDTVLAGPGVSNVRANVPHHA